MEQIWLSSVSFLRACGLNAELLSTQDTTQAKMIERLQQEGGKLAIMNIVWRKYSEEEFKKEEREKARKDRG